MKKKLAADSYKGYRITCPKCSATEIWRYHHAVLRGRGHCHTCKRKFSLELRAQPRE